MVTEQIFPAIPKINAKEPAVLMAILGIYQRISTGFSISPELWARTALPYLMFSSVDMSLNQDQYLQYVSFIETTHNKVKEEHLKKLGTMSAGQDAVRTGSASAVLSSTTPKSDSINALDAVFNPGGSRPSSASNTSTPAKQNSGVLSLEEKRRLAQQQEAGSVTNSTNDAFSDPLGRGKKVPMNQMRSSASPQPTISTDWLSSTPAPAPQISPQISPMSAFSANGLGSFSGLTGSTSASNTTFSDFDSMFPPSSSATSASSNANFGNLGSFGGLGLPQPPRSQNTAIQRKSGNPLDDLLSMGTNQNKIPMNQLNQSNGQNNLNSLNSLGSLTLNPTKSTQNSQTKDPFADLMS
ncbi:unnamed protein product, partial [Mesorhabditis belari]|uniref:Uncharacterized protein n=1 Tax=Mesorhabditis belari TaxID=2138241 RepID=A0AAF3ERX7_9BILA